VTLSRELEDQGLTPGMVRAWMMTDQGLVEDGFNKNARWLMYEACEKYGGVNKALESFNEYTSLRQIQLTRRSIEEKVEKLEEKKDKLSTDIEKLEMVIAQSREMIDAAKTAKLAGFSASELIMVSGLANKLGGPLKVADAIRKYSSLEEMEGELEGKRAELEKLKMEIAENSMFSAALKNTLEDAKREYDRNNDVRLLVELLANPRGIKMERSDVLSLLTRVLENGILRMEESPSILPLPSPALDAALADVKALAKRLRSIIDA
jgi:septal ring factor EnvC (AmiA/AmiB activator)